MTFPFARIGGLAAHVGATVVVQGWITHLRSSGKIAFLVVRDGTGTVQAVLVKKEVDEASWARFAELTHETSVRLTGAVRSSRAMPHRSASPNSVAMPFPPWVWMA